MYDVIIVGAGPAGGAAAYYLSKAGAKVLLLEKHKLPRFKSCAGGISAKFLASLPFDTTNALRGKVSQVRFSFNLLDPCDVALGEQMAMLNRAEFDYLIVKQAAALGAKVIDGVGISEMIINKNKVEIITDKGKFTANFLVGADGVHSQVAYNCGLRKSRSFWTAIDVEVPGLNNQLDKAYFGFGLVREGYAWVFPKSDSFSVGIGAKKERHLIKKLMQWLDFVGYKKSRSEIKFFAHAIPEPSSFGRLQKDNVLLVGDAAAVVDPLTGEGIRDAIRSAKIASDAIISGNIKNYTKAVFKEIITDFKYAYWLRWFLANYPEFTYRFGVKNKKAAQLIAKVFTGETSYGHVFRKVFAKAINPFALIGELRA